MSKSNKTEMKNGTTEPLPNPPAKASPQSKRYETIEAMKREHPVRQLCAAFEVKTLRVFGVEQRPCQ